MECFIVRVYHRDEKDPDRIVGLVEEAGGKIKVFHKIEKLISIIMRNRPETKGNIQKNRRRSDRLRLNLPVKVRGTNTMGEDFIEDTTLDNLSPWGAYLYASKSTIRDADLNLLIDPDHSNLEVGAKVVRLEKGNRKNGLGVFFKNKL